MKEVIVRDYRAVISTSSEEDSGSFLAFVSSLRIVAKNVDLPDALQKTWIGKSEEGAIQKATEDFTRWANKQQNIRMRDLGNYVAN